MWTCRIYPSFLPNLFGGLNAADANQIDILTDTIKLAILKSTYSPSNGHDFFDDVSSHEITDTGYVAGGVTIGGLAFAYASGSNSFKLDANDAIFDGADVDDSPGPRYGVLYKSTGTAATSLLIGLVDFGDVNITDPNTNSGPQYGVLWDNILAAMLSGCSFSTGMVSWYGKAIINALGGETAGEDKRTDYLSDTIKCALLSSSYTPDLDTHEVYSDLTNEVSGSGYPSGGVTLTGKSLSLSAATGLLTIGCSNILFPGITVTNARYAAIYNDTNASKPLLWLANLGQNYSPSDDVTIEIPPDGLARLSCVGW